MPLGGWWSPLGEEKTCSLRLARLRRLRHVALLSRRRSCIRLRLRGLRRDRIGHQAHVNAAVFGASRSAAVRSDGLVFAEADVVDRVCRNAVRREVLDHGCGAALAEIVVVVIEVRDRVLKHASAIAGLAGYALCLVGELAGGKRLLVSLRRLGVNCADALLGALVDIADLIAGVTGKLVELIGLIDNRRGLLANILLGRTTSGRKCQASGQDQSNDVSVHGRGLLGG